MFVCTTLTWLTSAYATEPAWAARIPFSTMSHSAFGIQQLRGSGQQFDDSCDMNHSASFVQGSFVQRARISKYPSRQACARGWYGLDGARGPIEARVVKSLCGAVAVRLAVSVRTLFATETLLQSKTDWYHGSGCQTFVSRSSKSSSNTSW